MFTYFLHVPKRSAVLEAIDIDFVDQQIELLGPACGSKGRFHDHMQMGAGGGPLAS